MGRLALVVDPALKNCIPNNTRRSSYEKGKPEPWTSTTRPRFLLKPECDRYDYSKVCLIVVLHPLTGDIPGSRSFGTNRMDSEVAAASRFAREPFWSILVSRKWHRMRVRFGYQLDVYLYKWYAQDANRE